MPFLSISVPVIIILFSVFPNIMLAFCLHLVDGLTSPLAPLQPGYVGDPNNHWLERGV